ncbi:MAG: hypothetical protein C0597_08525, partial [Marinilabiliales bacterium]
MNLKLNLIKLITFLLFISLVSCENNASNQKKDVKQMHRSVINPWTWQDKYGFVQANDVTAANRTLYT